MDEQLLQTINDLYGLQVHSFDILHDTSRTKVIVIHSDKGSFALKQMYIAEDRQNFILEVEEYLRNRGVNIPEVIPTLENKPYFLQNGYPSLLQQWIFGEPFHYERCVNEMAVLLGKIHAASVGFRPSMDIRSTTNRWEKKYETKLSFMTHWGRTKAKTKNPQKRAILLYLDFFLTAGREVHKQLCVTPHYSLWTQKQLHEQYLCHGDLHSKNVLTTGDHLYVIDWEMAKYEFPSRDISTVLQRIMSYDNKWDADTFTALLSSYLTENELTNQELFLLYLDLAFPHRLVRILKKQWYRTMSLKEIRNFLEREQQKTTYMLKMMHLYV